MLVATTPTACEWARDLSNEPYMKIILLFKIVACLGGVVATSYLLLIKGIRWLNHPNAKIIYVLHLVFSGLVALASCGCYTFDFIRLSSKQQDPCNYALPMKYAFHTRIIAVAFISAQIYSMLCFAIERAYSTVKPIEYENITKPVNGIVLGLILCGFGYISQYVILLPGVDMDSVVAVYAVRTEENAERYKINVYIVLVLECVTILLFWLALRRNNLVLSMDYKTRSLRLCNKYQVTENQRLIKLLLPCFVLHFLLTMFCLFGIALYPAVIGNWDAIKHTLWVESFSQFHVYSLVMPIVLLKRMKNFQHPVTVDRNPAIDEYFETLRLLFEKEG